MAEKIIKSNMIDEVTKDLVKYSIKVNRQRMIPDRRDGLKTVHRRIIDIMYNEIGAITREVKSARIVGDVLGKRHPHGDIAVYDAMRPLSQPYMIKIPILTPQGNWGTIEGDSQAAQRYTEIHMSKYGVDCIIGELANEKNVVDWIPTFDNSSLEPEFLPVRVPNLLINGAFGIGFGMRVSIPSHNMNEVIDATIKLIKNPNAQVVLVPDHCQPCEIIDTNFKAICNTGNGSYRVRGIIDIEEIRDGQYQLVIKSTPDLVFLNKVMAKIEEMIEKNQLQGIQETIDENEITHLRQILVLKKGTNPEYVRDLIYKRTDMEKSDSINFEVLDGLEPLRMSYKAYLLSFIEFRKVCKFRLYCNEVQALDTKFHRKDAFIRIIQSGEIEDVISKIRKNKDTNDVNLIEYLIKKFKITDLQAEYIINANLKKLSEGYLSKYLAEAKELKFEIDKRMEKILNEELIVEEIVEELLKYKNMYGSPRICKIISQDEINKIPKGEFKIIITKNNTIKKLPLNVDNGKLKDDKIKFIITACNTEAILLFDQLGRVFRIPVHTLMTNDKNDNGVELMSIIKKCTSQIVSVMYEPTLIELSKDLNKHYLVSLSSKGNIKKMDLDDFNNTPKSGMLYTKTSSSDIVKDILIVNETDDVSVAIYNNNKVLKIPVKDIPHQRRNTIGSKTFSNNTAEGMSLVHDSIANESLLVITNRGYVNKIPGVTIPLSGRNRAGSSVIKLGRNDSIKAIITLTSDDRHIQVDTTNGVQIIDPTTIQNGSSISKGVKAISLKSNDVILDIQ